MHSSGKFCAVWTNHEWNCGEHDFGICKCHLDRGTCREVVIDLNDGGFHEVPHMDVSKNSGTPKWMVYNKKNPIKMDDLRVPLFLETPIYLTNMYDYLTTENVG